MTQDETGCRRCGTCCRRGGPALHLADLPLLREGRIDWADVVTLRAGELVREDVARDGELTPLEGDLLKLRGVAPSAGDWTCVHYDAEARGCGIYEDRPLECRALDCRDLSGLREAYELERLSRRDVLGAEHPLCELLAEHDERCHAGKLRELATLAAEGNSDAGDVVVEMLRYDRSLRGALSDKAELTPEQLEFLLGRPLGDTLDALGFRLQSDADGWVTVVRKNTTNAGARATGRDPE